MLTWRGKSLQDLTETQLRAALTEAVSEMLGPREIARSQASLSMLLAGVFVGALLAALGFVFGMRVM